MRTRIRRGLDALIAGLARLAVRIFFREVRVAGREHLPARGPLLVVANHVNNLIDPMLILGCVGRRPRFLAKSTLWRHPVVAPLVIVSDCLPVYRPQDASAEMSRNLDTFVRARRVLARGGTVALFPEGRSHNEPGRLPLKTGAARIALQAVAEGGLALRIVPVGLVYENKERFRSRVLVQIGPPLDPAPEVARYAEEPRTAVRELTDRIGLALGGVLPPAAVIGAPAPEAPHLGSWPRLAGLVLWPVLAIGLALNWLPYRLPGWVSRAFTSTPDEPATYKVMTAFLAFPLAWVVETLLAARLGGPAWALVLALVAPTSGYLALLVYEARPKRC